MPELCDADLGGLSSSAAAARLAHDGPNELPAAGRPTALRRLVQQLASGSPRAWLSLPALAITIIIIIIIIIVVVVVVVVVLNALFAFFEYSRADRAAAQQVTVRRDAVSTMRGATWCCSSRVNASQPTP